MTFIPVDTKNTPYSSSNEWRGLFCLSGNGRIYTRAQGPMEVIGNPSDLSTGNCEFEPRWVHQRRSRPTWSTRVKRSCPGPTPPFAKGGVKQHRLKKAVFAAIFG